MRAKAVLFDFDNTLYPYAPCNRAGKDAARAAARELGYEFDRGGFEAFYQTGRRAIKREVPGTAASHDRYLYFKRALERHTGRPKPTEALALGEAYWRAYIDAMELLPDVEATLESLRDRGIDVGVVTNFTARTQLEKLEAVGLGDDLDLLVTSEETGREKPGSVMFTLALSRLDRRPSEAVMVGDNVEADIVGANAVGLETVLFSADGDDPDGPLEGDREPDHRIDSVAALPEVVL
ncbi:HAD-superfamily hydrolase [Natrinema pellirubrum DSM 15624]|uniref:HAD-superfamily hydrolase n=1 Tax=Natrinema pellirubrum (strain DSM 15624 / CIP 106293 / JCM 10476 / NCIMB 786 / 157) TaxID=797303 RepID=L0JGP8_NATP1|nr:HAD family hydrolase [Natrinema pellirubrum]AGB30705.1 haloacid dehalogenase superfamily enzyme, subfamily IA [Natrinema pellirubrum DSM 15624]ELY80371.1 HAD-superfamily hydrolase [Natrinema pellirubrum DSM 15624]